MRSDIKFLFPSCLIIFSLSAVAMENPLEEELSIDDQSSDDTPALIEPSNKRNYSTFLGHFSSQSFAGLFSYDVFGFADQSGPDEKRPRVMTKRMKLDDIQKLREQFSELKVDRFKKNAGPMFDEITCRKQLLREVGPNNKQIGLIFGLSPSFIHKTRGIVIQRLRGDQLSLDLAFDALEPLIFGVRDKFELGRAIKLLSAPESDLNEIIFIDEDEDINAKLALIHQVILDALT